MTVNSAELVGVFSVMQCVGLPRLRLAPTGLRIGSFWGSKGVQLEAANMPSGCLWSP